MGIYIYMYSPTSLMEPLAIKTTSLLKPLLKVPNFFLNKYVYFNLSIKTPRYSVLRPPFVVPTKETNLTIKATYQLTCFPDHIVCST